MYCAVHFIAYIAYVVRFENLLWAHNIRIDEHWTFIENKWNLIFGLWFLFFVVLLRWLFMNFGSHALCAHHRLLFKSTANRINPQAKCQIDSQRFLCICDFYSFLTIVGYSMPHGRHLNWIFDNNNFFYTMKMCVSHTRYELRGFISILHSRTTTIKYQIRWNLMTSNRLKYMSILQCVQHIQFSGAHSDNS